MLLHFYLYDLFKSNNDLIFSPMMKIPGNDLVRGL
jgi:hypothetical protein